MVELFQEGIIILISFILGASLLLLVQPYIVSINEVIVDGGNVVLNDLKQLLRRCEGYLVKIKIENKFHASYDGEVLSLRMYEKKFSTPARLGAYSFELMENCTMRFDGRGWKVGG